MLACAIAAPAAADAVPGALYHGVAADNASIQFTVSSDGTLVDSYSISGASGTDANGNGCRFNAGGDKGVWQGAPIQNNAFSYSLGNAILFQGSFTGPQSASGVFRLYDAPNSSSPGCDTGDVTWTASTTATPPPGSGGSGGGTTSGGSGGSGGTGTSSGSGGQAQHAFATRISIRKLAKNRLGGRVSSVSAACRAGRTVILWRGSRRMARTKTSASGSYSFARSAKLRGRVGIRVSATRRTVQAGTCVAGSSVFIHL